MRMSVQSLLFLSYLSSGMLHSFYNQHGSEKYSPTLSSSWYEGAWLNVFLLSSEDNQETRLEIPI